MSSNGDNNSGFGSFSFGQFSAPSFGSGGGFSFGETAPSATTSNEQPFSFGGTNSAISFDTTGGFGSSQPTTTTTSSFTSFGDANQSANTTSQPSTNDLLFGKPADFRRIQQKDEHSEADNTDVLKFYSSASNTKSNTQTTTTNQFAMFSNDEMDEEEEEEEADAIEIRRPPVAFAFGLGNQIAVSYIDSETSRNDEATGEFEILNTTDRFEDSEAIWQWLSESAESFLLLQQHYKQSIQIDSDSVNVLVQNNAWRRQILESSRMYRACLKNRINALQEDESLITELEYQALHLIEILEVYSVQNFSGNIGPHIVKWIQDSAFHRSDATPEIIAILQGRKDEALRLLASKYQYSGDDVYQRVVDLIQKRPQYDELQMREDFSRALYYWKSEVKVTLADIRQRNSVDEELKTILQILSGDVSDLEGYSWIDLVCASILYNYPCLNKDELPDIVAEIISEADISEEFPWESAVYMIMSQSFDISSILHHFGSLFSDWWSAHVVDLVWHCRQVNSSDFNGVYGWGDERKKLTELRDSYLIGYGNALLTNSQLFKFAGYYFQNCSVGGEEKTALCLERTPITSEKQCVKLYSDAQKQSLPEVERSAHVIMGMKYIKQMENLAAGIRHLVIAKEYNRVTSVISNTLKRYASETSIDTILMTGSFGNLQLLESVGAAKDVQSKELQLIEIYLAYAKTRSFVHLKKLLHWPSVMKEFYLIIITHAVYHIATKSDGFNHSDLILILQRLEDLTISHRHLAAISSFTSSIDAMRLVLNEQLSKLILRV